MQEASPKTKATLIKRQSILAAAVKIYDTVISEVKGDHTLASIKAFNSVDMHFEKLKKTEPANGSLYDSVYFDFRQHIKTRSKI